MEQNLFRQSPLPLRRKTLGQILAFGVVSILLISMFTFLFMNQRILCEGTGGRWIVYPQWIQEYENRHPELYIHWANLNATPEMTETWGKCFR